MDLRPQSSPSRSRTRPTEAFWDELAAAACRRSYPRVHGNVPVRFSDTGGGSLELTTNDLSTGGLQLACDRRTASRLRPDDAANGAGPTYAIRLLLEMAGRSLQVKGKARVVHMSLLPEASADAEVAVGVQFLDFESGGAATLERFIEHHMCPPEG